MVEKPFSQACENNKAPILAVIRRHFIERTVGNESKKILEVGSGTGQHAVYFAEHLPHLFWQTSDLPVNHAGINAWINSVDLPNVGKPLALDVCENPWPCQDFDGVFSANTCHIMPWEAVQHFITRVGNLLPNTGKLCLYGPFNYQGQYTSDSNARFDQYLNTVASHQGIRDFEAINALAGDSGLTLLEDNAMPANNRLLLWEKISVGKIGMGKQGSKH